MKIFDTTKTIEIIAPDLTAGKLVTDKRLIAHHNAVPAILEKTAAQIAAELTATGKQVEQTKNGKLYEVLETFPNGGKTVKEIHSIPAIPAREAYDEYEDIQVYIPYTAAELAEINAQKQIAEAKTYLNDTDYIVLKIAEAQAENDIVAVGALKTEYAAQLAKRKTARETINLAQSKLK